MRDVELDTASSESFWPVCRYGADCPRSRRPGVLNSAIVRGSNAPSRTRWWEAGGAAESCSSVSCGAGMAGLARMFQTPKSVLTWMVSRRDGKEPTLGKRMRRRRRKELVGRRIALLESGNREGRERTRTVNRVVLVLRRTGIVQAEVAKVRRGMAAHAVPYTALLQHRGRRRHGIGHRKEDLQPSQFGFAECELLRMQLERAVRRRDEAWLLQPIDQNAQPAAVSRR